MPCDTPRPKPTVKEPRVVTILRNRQERESRSKLLVLVGNGTLGASLRGVFEEDSMASRLELYDSA